METGQAAEMLYQLNQRIDTYVSEAVYAHQHTTKLLFGAFLLGGHVLLEGPPGIAKTLLAKTFAQALGLSFNRIQFTPDLMPSDITGVNVFDPSRSEFKFVPGPLLSDIVLADEINRTPPKTQAALLEAMQERQLTVDGVKHVLGEMFFVVATQNPIEHEGTFPLPEAQLDRFLFLLKLNYPDLQFESQMIQALSGPLKVSGPRSSNAGVSKDELLKARELLRTITLSPAISDYIMRIVVATREHPDIILGISPRGALNLALASKLQAALSRRDYVIPDDVKEIADSTLNHRLLLRPEAYESADSASQLLNELVVRIPPPANA